MTQGPRYRVKYRRIRKGLTDYRTRLGLLKSGKLRMVVRRSNEGINCQIVEYHVDGDKTIVAASSQELSKYGYKGHKGNIPAAYLVGYMCGLKAKKKKIESVILDVGLYRMTKGSRIFAVLKGAIDAGLEIPHDEKILPQERVVQGYHIADYSKILKAEKPEKYEKLFSKILKNKIEPENITEHIQEVKKRLSGEFA